MIMGVCGGIGEHYGWDPTKVRLAFALIFIFSAGLPIVIFYIICAIVVPE
jgi:phage shock protein C